MALCEPNGSSATPYLLPTDLPKALNWLTVHEFDTLAKAVQIEKKKRAASSPTDAELRAAGEPSKPYLLKPRVGQINAIRAAIKAGAKATTVAKQFGVSKATVAEIAKQPLFGNPRA